jgi:uncharacterized protein (DUF1778 family)
MAAATAKKETPVSMRFRNDDLAIIDRGAAMRGLSRTEFMRRAALHDAQVAMLNESVVRISDETFADFLSAIEGPVTPLPPKAQERLNRKAPWA